MHWGLRLWVGATIGALLAGGVAIYAVRGPAILLDLGTLSRMMCL